MWTIGVRCDCRRPAAHPGANRDPRTTIECTGHPRAASEVAAQLIPGAQLVISKEFEEEWPPLQQQALANYEKPSALPKLIGDWLAGQL